MRSWISASIILCVALSVSAMDFPPKLQVYRHPYPRLNIQFIAPADWVEIPWHDDNLAYEVMDPDSTVHVLLWYTETEQDGPGYLRKMADMKDLTFEEELHKQEIQGREAWVATTSGVTNDIPINLILAVIETDHSLLPKHNALYIIQIWCAKEDSAEHIEQMTDILNSVEIIDPIYVSVDTTKWELMWSDEFDYEGLPDSTKWNYEVGFVRNAELQYYTRARHENARVKDGMLIIEGRKERIANPKYKAGSDSWILQREYGDYTSASVTTRNKAGWKYGRIEVRAKLPQGKGTWPAIWMMGTNLGEVRWPTCGEIDIMEFVGKEPDWVHANVHYAIDGKHQSGKGKLMTEKPYMEFHIYALEWYPDRFDFYFDDTKYYTFPLNKAGFGKENPFRKPQFLLVNLALGGSWGGKIDDAILPQRYLIDYVRIYQEKH